MKRLFILTLIIAACQTTEQRRQHLREMVTSKETNTVVKGYFLIGESRDSSFAPLIFNHPGDPRISHHLRFKGMSIYQQKMGAMQKITGIPPPTPITYEVDSGIIHFYAQIARQRQWIK